MFPFRTKRFIALLIIATVLHIRTSLSTSPPLTSASSDVRPSGATNNTGNGTGSNPTTVNGTTMTDSMDVTNTSAPTTTTPAPPKTTTASSNNYCPAPKFKDSCIVVGVGLYVFDITDIDLLKGTFFASYQLALYQSISLNNETVYKTCKEAMDNSMDNKICQDVDMVDRWKPYVLQETSRELIFHDAEHSSGSSDVDYTDSEYGRYYVKGKNYFSPEFKGYPFDRHTLKLNVTLRSQTLPCPRMHSTQIRFCRIRELSGIQIDTIPALLNSRDGKKETLKSSSFDISSSCWPPLLYVESGKKTQCTDADKADSFSLTIKYGLDGEKAFDNVGLTSFISALLALSSYFVPPHKDWINMRFDIFVFAVLNVAVSENDSVDKFLAKAPPFTRADYIDVACLMVLFLAIFHGLLIAWIIFWKRNNPNPNPTNPKPNIIANPNPADHPNPNPTDPNPAEDPNPNPANPDPTDDSHPNPTHSTNLNPNSTSPSHNPKPDTSEHPDKMIKKVNLGIGLCGVSNALFLLCEILISIYADADGTGSTSELKGCFIFIAVFVYGVLSMAPGVCIFVWALDLRKLVKFPSTNQDNAGARGLHSNTTESGSLSLAHDPGTTHAQDTPVVIMLSSTAGSESPSHTPEDLDI